MEKETHIKKKHSKSIKRTSLPLLQRLKILDVWQNRKISISELAAQFGCSNHQIRYTIKKKDKFLTEWSQGNAVDKSLLANEKKQNKKNTKHLNRCLFSWYQQQVRNKNKVTDLLIKEQAKYYARLLHYNEFVPSNIWLHNFKKCYKVTSVTRNELQTQYVALHNEGKTNYDEKLFLPIQRLPLDYSKKSTLLKNNNQEAGINLIKEKCSTTKLQLLDTQKEKEADKQEFLLEKVRESDQHLTFQSNSFFKHNQICSQHFLQKDCLIPLETLNLCDNFNNVPFSLIQNANTEQERERKISSLTTTQANVSSVIPQLSTEKDLLPVTVSNISMNGENSFLFVIHSNFKLCFPGPISTSPFLF